ncbi:MAG: hypothetical protein OEZ59_12085 [Deltaproteobacteria bacterium]|nr:hypothetical protein [Deltaproteobacteria bacterium]
MKTNALIRLGLLLSVTMLVAAGCGGSDDAEETKATPLTEITGTSGATVNLDGTWKSPCVFDSEKSEYWLDVYTKTGGSIAFTSTNHAVGDCVSMPVFQMAGVASVTKGAEGTIIWWSDYMGTVTNPATIPDDAVATTATVSLSAITMTILNSLFEPILNGMGTCGKTDWTVDVPVNILNCTDFVESKSWKEYWAVVDDVTPMELYTGEMYDMSDNLLPYVIGYFDPMTKQ